jgi:poly(3-hydroxybutyrate) depolymerase/putative intracellular protease/amidase
MKKWIIGTFVVLNMVLSACTGRPIVETHTTIGLVLAEKNFDEVQYSVLKGYLQNKGITALVISGNTDYALSNLNRPVAVDYSFNDINIDSLDGIIVIGGKGIQGIQESPTYRDFIKAVHEGGLIIGALEYAPPTLDSVISGKKVVCWPSEKIKIEKEGGIYTPGLTVSDGNLITGMGGSDANTRVFFNKFYNEIYHKKNKEASPLPYTEIENGERYIMDHAGFTRTGSILQPDNQNRPWSLVFALHGMGGTGYEFLKNTDLKDYSNELNLMIIYADGYNGDWDILSTNGTSYDEMHYFQRLIKELLNRYPIDPERIYITGLSLGGYMSYRLAADMTGTFAAAAPVAGLWYPPKNENLKIEETSLLHIHALDDRMAPYTGDPLYGVPVPVETSIDLWKRALSLEKMEESILPISELNLRRWSSSESSSSVSLLVHEQGGHMWLRGSSEYITDFFFNTPPRSARIVIDNTRLPSYPALGSPLEIRLVEEDFSAVNSVEYFANGQLLGKIDKAPYILNWTPVEKGETRLTALAQVKSGEVIPSTLNPVVSAVDPFLNSHIVACYASVSESETHTPEKAFDLNPWTRWSSTYEDVHYLEAELDEPALISGVTLNWEVAYSKGYSIDLSMDEENWTTVYSTIEGKGKTEVIEFAPKTARFIRIHTVKRATEWGNSLWDVIIHGE